MASSSEVGAVGMTVFSRCCVSGIVLAGPPRALWHHCETLSLSRCYPSGLRRLVLVIVVRDACGQHLGPASLLWLTRGCEGVLCGSEVGSFSQSAPWALSSAQQLARRHRVCHLSCRPCWPAAPERSRFAMALAGLGSSGSMHSQT